MTSLYEATIPVYIRYLGHASKVLTKAETWAKENGVAETDIMTARLAPDMLPFTFQAQTLSNTTKRVATLLCGVTNAPYWPDDEKSFADLQKRISDTIDFLRTIPSDSTDGKEDIDIIWKLPDPSPDTLTAKAWSYSHEYAMPSFFFHFGMLYAILRMKGVPVGKFDFIGEVLTRVPREQ